MKYWTLSPSNQFSSPLSLLLSPFWSCYKNWTIAKMQELGYSHTNAEWKKPVLKSTCYITPFIWKKWSEVKWSCSVCPTLCDPIDCGPPSSSVHGIFQARILEWVAISLSRESSWPRDWTHIPAWHAEFLTTEPPGKPSEHTTGDLFCYVIHGLCVTLD